MSLTPEQRAAIDMVVDDEPALCLLTGGPGTGKSYTTAELLRALRGKGRTWALCAPSGKAAQRLAEASGEPASTIHRLLGMRPGTDEVQLVDADVVVVDESSMVDVELMARLLGACEAGGVRTVLLVGDPEQLPPVGPGAPFHDLVQSGAAPVARLTVVQRQALDSGIVRAAYAIRDGKVPDWCADFRFVNCEQPEDVAGCVLDVLTRELEALPEVSQVLSCQRRGLAGVDHLNAYLEDVRGDRGPEVRGLREGTKVIQTRNDYKRQVFNGEGGFVERVEPGDKPRNDLVSATVNGSAQDYVGAAIKDLQPAWALTTHKAQGSEWPDVVFVAHDQHGHMLTRSLLYVAVTRASERCVVVGTERAVSRAVRKVSDLRRRTNLARLLAREVR